jgi:hypothetical protein
MRLHTDLPWLLPLFSAFDRSLSLFTCLRSVYGARTAGLGRQIFFVALAVASTPIIIHCF